MGSINPSYSNYYCWLVMNLQWKRVSSGLPSRLQEVLEMKHPRPPLNLSIWWTVLWYWAAESCWLFCIEEKGYRETCIRDGNMVFWAAQLRNHSSLINFVLHWLNYDLHRVMSTRAWTVICKCYRFKHVFVSVRLIYLFFDLKYIAVALFCVIWLKLKSSSFKRTFSTLLSATLLYHLEAAC